MTEPEDFIARWSRRKAAATEGREAQTEPPADDPVPGEEAKSAAPPEPAQSETEVPAIDPATLPPIESIEAGTDIATFLRAGVPADITRAALRRAWATDPAIRDFIGLAENAWDFTAPDGVPGFGPLSAADASRLMNDFSGKASETFKKVAEQIRSFETPAELVQAAPSPSESDVLPVRRDSSEDQARAEPDQPAEEPKAVIESILVQRDKENVAVQNNSDEPNGESHRDHRTHGRALPE